MATKKKKEEISSTQKIEIGIGLTAAAVAAAGAYFLYGSKTADKNRKVVKSWALKAKAEVLEKLEETKKMTRGEYEDVVKGVIGNYSGLKNASKGDLKSFALEMMDNWSELEKSTKPKKKTTRKAAKKPVAKKTTPKKKAAPKKRAVKK